MAKMDGNIDEVKEFKELVQREDFNALDYWYDKLNPLVKGLEKARKACLVSLASGGLVGNKRSRINVLLYGPGGTGKSEIRNWIKDNLGAVGASPQSSGVGLVYDARGEGTKGALALAHRGTCVIEELSQFKKGVRETLRQAMESGYYEINKGDKRKRIDTKCKVIAAANQIDDFSDPLLQRFDFKIHIPEPDKEEEKEITDYIYDRWEDEEEQLRGLRLSKYLKWVKSSSQPSIDEETKAKFKRMKNLYIDIAHRKGKNGSTREKETFYRTAKTIARLNKEDVKEEHFVEAIELHNGDMPDGVMQAIKNV